MKKWTTVSREPALKTDHMTVVKAEVELPNGVVSNYFYEDSPGSVMVIPVKPGKAIDSHAYIMVRQYRYPVGSYDLEFPAGRRNSGESILDAALRELREETGYQAKEIKLLYMMHASPGASNASIAVCLAAVDPAAQSEPQLDGEEANSYMKVEELSPEELHKKILSMDITDSATLAAIAVFTMNSQSATQYLSGSTEER